MTIGVGVDDRVVAKSYAVGTMTSNAKAVSASDLVATGGQILRRVSGTLDFNKQTYQSAEIRSDYQIADFRHGLESVLGALQGEISPGTYSDIIEAAFRGTRVSAIAKSEAEFTSAAADGPTSKFTFAGGDPVTEGYRVGMPLRFTNLSEALNNDTNFVITAFGGASNREVTVFPAPTTMAADAAFNVTSVGKQFFIPSAGHVKRKFGLEVYNSGLDIARLFTECRSAGLSIQLPAQGMATIQFPFAGRDMELYEAGAAPFFTGPAAESTSGIFAAVNGAFLKDGVAIGVCTGASIDLAVQNEAPAVIGQKFTPEIFLGRAVGAGQFQALFENNDYFNAFKLESELQLLLYLTTTSAANSPAWTVLLPRVKLGSASTPQEGELGITTTCQMQLLKYQAVAAATGGIENTTIQICDTESA